LVVGCGLLLARRLFVVVTYDSGIIRVQHEVR
jgi:hypothetical protein